MNALELLLSRRWIVKEANKDLYYKAKDEIGEYKRFITEKLGYPLIINPYLIRLEKTPAVPEAWMGITDFSDRIEYVFLCLVLMFLEDKDAGEQFILSQLTEYIQVTDKYEEVEWTNYSTRKHLIKVMKFCLANHMIRVNDGSEDSFASDYEGDVLYENTGTSRYFMKNFTRNIEDYTNVEDFQASEWIGMDEERGIIRRQRVYRTLIMGMGLYKEGESDEDFAYVKNYHNMMEEELSGMMECELQVHKTSAYLILGEHCDLGKGIPSENGLSDIVMLLNKILREKVETGAVCVTPDDRIELSETEFQKMLEECRECYGSGFIKQYRTKTTGDFVKTIQEYLENLEWIVRDSNTHRIQIKPVMGKVIGTYPKDYVAGGAQDEQ